MVGIRITDQQKASILAYRKEYVPNHEIGFRVGCSIATVKRIVKNAIGLPPNVVPRNKPCSGRPRKTSKTTDHLLMLEIKKNPRLTAADIKRSHPALLANMAQ